MIISFYFIFGSIKEKNTNFPEKKKMLCENNNGKTQNE